MYLHADRDFARVRPPRVRGRAVDFGNAVARALGSARVAIDDPATTFRARVQARALALASDRQYVREHVGDRLVGYSSDLIPPGMGMKEFGAAMRALGWTPCYLQPREQNEYGDAARVRGWRHKTAPRPRRGRAPHHASYPTSRYVPTQAPTVVLEHDPDVVLPLDPRDHARPRVGMNILMRRLTDDDRAWLAAHGPAIESTALELLALRPAGQLTIKNLRAYLSHHPAVDGLLVRELQHLGYEPLMHPPWREAHGFGPYQAAPWVRPVRAAPAPEVSP